MFIVKLNRGHLLKKIIGAIKEILVHAVLECSPFGIFIHALDPSNICFVFIELHCDGFDEYVCDKTQMLGIDVNALSSVLNGITNTDFITMSGGDNADIIKFVYHSQNSSNISSYNLKLLNLEQENMELPNEFDHTCMLTMPSQEFFRICRDINQIGNDINIKITFTGNQVKFSAVGDKLVDVKITINQDNISKDKQINFTVNQSTSATFSGKYLNLFTRATPLSENVYISIYNSILKVEYKIDKSFCLSYFLSSKIEDDINDSDIE